jgi:hypothetical protein
MKILRDYMEFPPICDRPVGEMDSQGMGLKYAVCGAFLGVLNNTNFQEHIDLQARCISEASGAVQKSMP